MLTNFIIQYLFRDKDADFFSKDHRGIFSAGTIDLIRAILPGSV